MILADFGAEVIRMEHPLQAAHSPIDAQPATPMWRRGQRAIALDLNDAEAMQSLRALCADADVLLTNLRESSLRKFDLHYDGLQAAYPHLIYAHLTGFGRSGPWQDLPAYEHLVAAASGRMLAFQGIVDRPGPVFSALQVGVHATAQSLVTGILAALLQRARTGRGNLVDTSLLQGMLPYEQGAMLGSQYPDQFGAFIAGANSAEPPMPSLYYHPIQAGDGRWMQFGNLLPHLFDNFLLVTDLTDVLADPDFEPRQLLLRGEKHEAFRDRMLERIQSRPSAAWMADCVANGGVVATTYQTTQQALSDPDITANGHVVPMGDSGQQLGPLARMLRTPAQIGGPCETINQARFTSANPTTHAAADQAASSNPTAPLAGVKVVEVATIIAAPLGASFLADLGADVIKVEQVGGDPYRGLMNGMGAARVNAGKRSISVDLKSPAGQELLLKLMQDADVVIHNYRPGVPERLGFGYDAVSAINPGVVYLQCNGYGPDGPGRLRPSTHPIPGAAMGGVLFQLGERVPQTPLTIAEVRQWSRRLMRANEVNPDPNTALVIASSAMLGLASRMLHSPTQPQGQKIIVDMFGANAYANADDFINYPGKAARSLPDEMLYGLSPCYRLYPCQNDQWVFLALVSAADRQRFANLTAIDVAVLEANDERTETRLTELFATADADTWESRCVSQRIGCLRADRQPGYAFWLHHPQAHHAAATQAQTHPAWGSYQRHPANVTVGTIPQELGPPPLAGQHNVEIATNLGYSVEEIEQLHKAGVLWAEQVTP